MFKAFTDNISSFINSAAGGSDDKSTEEEKNNSQSEPPEQQQGQDSSTTSTSVVTEQSEIERSKGDGTESAQTGSLDNEGRRSSKVPPPRPNPPLTSGASISKQDSDDKTKSDHSSETAGDAKANDNVESADASSKKGGKKDRLDDTLDEVAGKAKEWGSYLFNVTKSAGASVGAKAMELKKVVTDNTIIGDFVKEQDKFVSAKKERARANEAAVPPWVGYNEEEQMRTQMLTLSNDKRNFLRNPPAGVQFHFDYETCYPVAMATLAEDERLQEMRFKLVPKQVTEHDFWRNYFYRVSLIKQSTQLTSLAKQTTNSLANPDSATPSTPTDSESGKQATEKAKSANVTEPSQAADINDANTEDVDTAAGNDEFISDAYNLEISDEDLMKEMEALRASPAGDEEWEQELQKELTDFEVVGDANDIDDAALEKEIMSEMSSSDLK